jgi:hypothetical protein
VSLRKARPGVVLNRTGATPVALDVGTDVAPDVGPDIALDAASAPGAARERRDRGCSLGLCVLAPLCLASMAVIWEGLYAHRDRTEFAGQAAKDGQS